MKRKTVTTTATLILAAGIALAVEKALPLDEHYQTALAALAKGEADKAKRELKLSLQDNSLHSESHFLLASLLGREGDIDQAIVEFQQTTTLDSQNALARYTEDDMRRFKERYPDWNKLAPNRFASHFFLIENSAVYRAANGVDLASDNLDFDLLGKQSKKK